MRWPVRIYRVAGDSMEPTLPAGSFVLGSGWARRQAGRVVVVDPTRYTDTPPDSALPRKHIKRLKHTQEDGAWVEGDNPRSSTDSRQYGYLDQAGVRAVVLFRIT